MPTLVERIAAPEVRLNVVGACARLIDREVDAKGGLSGPRFVGRMRAHNRCFAVLVLLGLVSACESPSDSDSTADVSDDPRCNALCSVKAPSLEDAFSVCSGESLEQCGELCEVRIAGQTSLCAECLLEHASLSTPRTSADELCFEDDTCYVGLACFEGTVGCGYDDVYRAGYDDQVADGRACSFERDADEARADCIRKIYPREEVTCEPEFESVSGCIDLCGPGN